MAVACKFVSKISVSKGDSCDHTEGSSGKGEANLKDETLTKLTHMKWMRQPSVCSIGNSSLENRKSSKMNKDASVDPRSELSQRHSFHENIVSDSNISRRECCASTVGSRSRSLDGISSSEVSANQAKSTTSISEKISGPVIISEDIDEFGYERDTDSESPEGDALDRNLVLERRRNLVKSISKRFFKNVNPTCKNFKQFCFVDELSLRRAFDKVLSHHRYVSKTAAKQPSSLNAKSAIANISSSLNAQASPFCPQTKNVAVKESNDVYDDVKTDSYRTTPTSFAPVTTSPSSTIQVDPLLDTQSGKKVIQKRGYILNRRPLTENCAQISNNAQHSNRLDSQSQQQVYLQATLDELNALRLNNFKYLRNDDVTIYTPFVECYETQYPNLVPASASVRLIEVTSSMSEVSNSISDSKPHGLTSAANLNIAIESEHVPGASMIGESSMCNSSSSSVMTAGSLTNSSCQSVPPVTPYSISGKNYNPMNENLKLVSGTVVATVPEEVASPLWPPLDRSCQFSRGNSETNDYVLPAIPPRGVHDAKAVSLRSDSNQCYANFEARLKPPGISSVAPPRHADQSRPDACQSLPKQVFSTCRGASVPKSASDADVRNVLVSEDYETFVAGSCTNFLTRCDGNNSVKCTQSPRAVRTVVSNVPVAIGTTATFSSPPQAVFATGLRAISSCNDSDQFITSHLPRSNGIQFRPSFGTGAVDPKLGISEQYAANSSGLVTVSLDHVRTEPSDQRPMLDVASQKSIRQPTSFPHSATPSPVTQNISKDGSTLAESNISDQRYGNETNDVFTYRSPRPPATASRVTADQFLPVAAVPSFLGTDGGAFFPNDPNSYQPNPFARNAAVRTTAILPSIQSSVNTAGVCRRDVSTISDNFPAHHQRVIFSERDAKETKNGFEQTTPTSAVFSHSSTSAQIQSPSVLGKCFASAVGEHRPGTNTIAPPCPASHSFLRSHPDTSTFIPSRNSSFVRSGCDGMFAVAGDERVVYDKERSLALGEESDAEARMSQIEAGSYLPTPPGVPQLKRGESYPSSGSNLAPSSSCISNKAPQSSGQSAANSDFKEVASRSAPTARRGFNFPADFPPFSDGGDEKKPRWIGANVQLATVSTPDQVSGGRQSSGPPSNYEYTR